MEKIKGELFIIVDGTQTSMGIAELAIETAKPELPKRIYSLYVGTPSTVSVPLLTSNSHNGFKKFLADKDKQHRRSKRFAKHR